MAIKPQIDPALADIAVRAELFYLNLQDELANRPDLSPEEVQAAFARAMKNTTDDLQGSARPELPIRVLSTPRQSLRLRLTGPWASRFWAGSAALVVAALIRLSIYGAFGR